MSKVLAGFTILSLVLILFGINRGFDISDEGVYALLAVPEQKNIAGIFNYDLFFKLFYKITGIDFGIVGLRLLRLFFYFLAAISLSFFWRNLTGKNKLSYSLFFLSLLGLFTGYAFLPQSLSYNSLSVVLACFWLALISIKGKSAMQYFFIGLLLACMAYAKITTSFGLGLITLIWMIYSKEVKLINFLGLIIPYALIELIMYLVLDDFAFLRMLEATEMIGHRNDYSFLSLAKYSAVGFFWLVLVSIPFLIAGSFQNSHPKLSFLILAAGILVLACISYFTAITQEWNHIVLLLTAAIISYFAPRFPFAAISPDQRFSLLILLVLPFVLHFGSNVYWLRLSIHYWVFWMLAILYLLSLIQVHYMKPMTAAVGLIALLLVANGIWIHPFEQESLWNSTQKWSYGNGNQILLSEKQVDMLSEIGPYVRDQEQLLAFYRIPGIPYLLDKTSPKSPGYWTKRQTEYFYPSGIATDLLIFYPLDSLPSSVKDDFSKKYVQLPDGNEIQLLWRK